MDHESRVWVEESPTRSLSSFFSLFETLSNQKIRGKEREREREEERGRKREEERKTERKRISSNLPRPPYLSSFPPPPSFQTTT